MATKYARTAGGGWNTDATWSTTSGGAADTTKPTAADDVVLDSNSGNVTIDTTPVCRSLDCTSGTGTYAGVLTHNASTTLTIGDATAGAGNVALKLTAGMTYTLNNVASSALAFVSTSATVQTITTAGKNVAAVNFNGSGGSWKLLDGLTQNSTTSVTLTLGSLDTNGQTCSWGQFASTASNVRSLTFGSSSITTNIASTSAGWNVVSTNLTFNAGTSTITIAGSNSGFTGGTGLTYNNVVFPATNLLSTVLAIGAANTFNNLTITGAVSKVQVVNIGANQTVTGTFTVTGNSVTNRVLVQSNTAGTPRTITCSSAPSISNVDFQDITAAGTTPFTGTSMGDCGGNTNITFDAPATQTHTASAGGNWSDVTKWTSRVPLPQDDVVVDVNTTGTLTQDMPRMGKSINFTGFVGTFSNTTLSQSLYGSLTLASGMTFTINQLTTFAGRGSFTITSAGKSLSTTTFTGFGGTYTLQDALNTGAGAMSQSAGTIDSNGFTVTCIGFASTGTITRSVIMGTSTWNMAGGGIWNMAGSGLTMSALSGTIAYSSASTTARTFAGLGLAYGTLQYTVANSPGSLTITGANTFTNLNVASGRILTMPASTTNTIASGGTFNVNGAVNGYVYLPGVLANYISTPDSAALSIPGDIDIRLRLALDDWTPVSATAIMGKRVATGNQSSWYLRIDLTTGLVRLALSADGSALSTVPSSVAPTISDGSTLWLRATWRQSDGRVQFFTASGAITNPTASDFAQLGTDQTIAIASIFDSTAPVEVGSMDNGTAPTLVPATGKFYRAQLRNGLDGTLVYDADFTTKTVGANTFTESSANAATVTINGTLAQAGDGRVSLVSSTPGTQATLSKATGVVSVNYLSIQDSNATGGAGWYAGANSVNVSNNTGWHFTGLSTPTPNQFFNLFD